MKRYDTYKESGIEWIGEIPNDWKINKIKYLATVINGSTPDSGIDKYWDSDIDWVTPADISKVHDNYINNSIRKITEEGLKNCGTTLVPKGSVILTTRAPIGNVAIAGKELCTNQGCKSLLFKSNSNFYYYQFLAFKDQLEAAGNGSTFKELSTSSLKGFHFVMPSEKEKDLISSYLDKKTEKINQIIQQKELLLEKLQAKRQAIINEAVIRGLNPNVPMKPSGVGLVGAIPEHWKIVPFRYYINIKHGFQFRDFDFTDSGIKVVKIGQLSPTGDLDLSNVSFVDQNRLDEFKDILISEGDILMALTGGTIGKIIRVGRVNEPLLQNYRVGNFIPSKNDILKDYLFWILSSGMIQNQISFYVRETGQPNIGKENFNEMKIFIPPIQEQQEIMVWLSGRLGTIDKTKTLLIKQIQKIKEYRQSIISEVVTGKLKVV